MKQSDLISAIVNDLYAEIGCMGKRPNPNEPAFDHARDMYDVAKATLEIAINIVEQHAREIEPQKKKKATHA